MDFTYFPTLIFFIYLMHLLTTCNSRQKLNLFFNNIHYHVDKFLTRADDEQIENEDPPDEKTDQIKTPVRFEDKYKEEYMNLSDSALTTEQLDNFKNNIILENTPLGNVLMFFDNKKETFVFYSDLTIPYRFLEVVGRKYVVTYNCKQLFIDMGEELKISEEKKTKKQDLKVEVPNLIKNNISSTNTKKDVFAKFKTYNNNVTKEVVSAPSKNTGPNTSSKKENVLLKENANRYKYEGKLVNYNFLQPIDKKHVDKRAAMSWADYKSQL